LKPKTLRTSDIFEKETDCFDKDYKLLNPAHPSDAGGCLPVAEICNSENETVNYFSSKRYQSSRCSLSELPSFASSAACKYGGKPYTIAEI
jgi:hypothetical protein